MSNENGTLHYVITTSADYLSNLQVVAGLDAQGNLAFRSGNESATAGVTSNFNVIGLDEGTQYYVYFVANDSSNNMSHAVRTDFITQSNIYSVIFKDWDNATLKTETVNRGSSVTAPTVPTRTGFGGCRVHENVIANSTVTSQYKANEYTVSFDSNEGSAVSAIKRDYGEVITAPPTRTDYIFEGWYKKSSLTTAWNFAVDTVPDNGITLYAKWTSNNNGGAGDPS